MSTSSGTATLCREAATANLRRSGHRATVIRSSFAHAPAWQLGEFGVRGRKKLSRVYLRVSRVVTFDALPETKRASMWAQRLMTPYDVHDKHPTKLG